MSRADTETTSKAMANAEDAIEAKTLLCSRGESDAELKNITLMLLKPAINISSFDKQSATHPCKYVKGLAFGQLDAFSQAPDQRGPRCIRGLTLLQHLKFQKLSSYSQRQYE